MQCQVVGHILVDRWSGCAGDPYFDLREEEMRLVQKISDKREEMRRLLEENQEIIDEM